MREAWVSILANLVALVAIYSAFSVAIAIAQALGPATPINQVFTLAGAVVLGLVGVSGALFKLSDWFARHIEIGDEEPSSQDAAHPANGGPQQPQHAALDASTVYFGIAGVRFRLESQALMRQHLFGLGGPPWYEPLVGTGRARRRYRLVGLRGGLRRRLVARSGDLVVLGAGRLAGIAQCGSCGRALRGHRGSAPPAGLPRRLQRLLVLVCLARRLAGLAQAGDDPGALCQRLPGERRPRLPGADGEQHADDLCATRC